ncbi:hypothetical protein [Bacillus sp. Hm123]|uniref:hypothetical protein n=1 Tax=Bacillus sp. Hm123 TaxID=3450745 RepID=UPI003F437766
MIIDEKLRGMYGDRVLTAQGQIAHRELQRSFSQLEKRRIRLESKIDKLMPVAIPDEKASRSDRRKFTRAHQQLIELKNQLRKLITEMELLNVKNDELIESEVKAHGQTGCSV